MAQSIEELSDAELEQLAAGDTQTASIRDVPAAELQVMATKPSIEEVPDEELERISKETPISVDGLVLDRNAPKPGEGQSSTVGSTLRSAAMNVVPTLGGLVTGAGGFVVGGFAGPGAVVASPALGIAGAAAGGHVTAQAQDWVLKKALPEDTYNALQKQLAADDEEHPVSVFMGSFIPQAALFRPSPDNIGKAFNTAKNIFAKPKVFAKALSTGDPAAQTAFGNLLNVAIGAGTGGGTEAYREFQKDDPNYLNVALAFGFGALLNKPTAMGRALSFEKTLQQQQERFAEQRVQRVEAPKEMTSTERSGQRTVDESPAFQLPEDAEPLASGNEHDVYSSGNKVFKVLKKNGYGLNGDGEYASEQFYSDRVALQNKYFGDNLKIEGRDNRKLFITSQDRIEGVKPTQGEIERLLLSKGFVPESKAGDLIPADPYAHLDPEARETMLSGVHQIDAYQIDPEQAMAGVNFSQLVEKTEGWVNTKDGVRIDDATPDNFIKDGDGKIHAIDVIMSRENGRRVLPPKTVDAQPVEMADAPDVPAAVAPVETVSPELALERRAAEVAEADRLAVQPSRKAQPDAVDARVGESEPLGQRVPMTREEVEVITAQTLKQFPGAPPVKIVGRASELPASVRTLSSARASLGDIATQFKENVLRFMTGHIPAGRQLHLGDASEALKLGGLHEGPIIMKQDVLTKARDKHGIPLPKLMRLPEMLHDPIAVFDSATEPNASIVLTELQHGKQPIVAAVHLRETAAGVEINEIQSIHARHGSQISLAIENGLTRYYNKEKARSWLSQELSGVQFPAAWVQLQAMKNIRTNLDLPQVKNPPEGRASLEGHTGRIEAVLDPSGEKPQIYIVAENLHSPERVVKAVLEEVVGHYGVRQVTGAKFAKLVAMVWRDYKSDARLLEIAKDYGLDLKTTAGKAVAAEEFVAKLARNEIKEPTFLEKAVTWLRETLREIPAFKNLSLSEAELKSLLARAKRAVQNGPDGKPVQTPAASRGRGEAVDASVEPATLPRQIEAPPFVSPDGRPIALADIRQYLSQALDIPVRLGVGRKKALGFYSPRRESIRVRALNDIPTIAHEVGHYLHYILFPGAGVTPIASDFARQFDGELFPLGRVTSKPSYTPDQVRKEGVAEFFRQYLTDNTKALAAAPKFYNMFESALQQRYPEIWKIVGQAREITQKYIAQPDWEKAKAQISFDPDAAAQRWSPTEWAQQFYTRWVNELAPLENTMNYLQRLGAPAAQVKRVIDLAINYKGGWRGKAEHDLHLEQTNLDGKVVGPGLRQILSGIDDLREFSTYLALRRSTEKQRQGIKTGFEGLDVNAKLKELEPRYEAKRKQLAAYQDNAVNLLVESGILSAEQKMRMQKLNQDYVPFYRVYESVGGNAGGKTGKGFINLGNPVRRMKGSDLAIIDPLEAIVKNTYVFRDLAERQRVGHEFIKTVNATQGGGRVADVVAKPMKPVKVQHEEVLARLEQLLGEKLPKDLTDLSFTIFRASRGISAKDGVFSVWDRGTERLYQLSDPELARSLTMADSVDAEVMAKIPFMGAFKRAAGILRIGATLTPEFMLRNYFRDQLSAAVFSKHGFIPFFDGARGIFSAIRKDEWYREWAKSGGRYAGISVLGREDMRTTLAEITRSPGAAQMALDLMNPRNVLANLAKASEIMETGTRIAEFRRAREGGETALAAANAAKDVTLNFSRYGMKGKVVNQMSAFFNAAIQDMDKIVRAHKERPLQTALKGFLYVSVPSILGWYLGKDDAKIQELPEWRKQLFWNVNLDGFVLSVPKPFLLGAIYGTSMEKALDFAYGKDPNAINKLGQALMQNTLIRDDLLVALNLFRPTIENITNYSFFREAPIVPRSMQALSPELQFSPGTSHVARWLGSVLNVSPLKIDNAIRGHFGGLGKYSTDAIDFTLGKLGLIDVPVEPAKNLSELPLLRSFAVSPYAPSEYVERFFKSTEKAEQRLRDFAKLKERMDQPAMREYWLQHRNEGMWYQSTFSGTGRTVIGEIRAQRKALGEISKAMALVQESKKMTADEKRERLHYLKEARDTIAKNVYLKLIHPTDRKATF